MAATPREVTEMSDLIIECVSDDDASRGVWLGDDGILAGATPDKLPQLSRILHLMLPHRGKREAPEHSVGDEPSHQTGRVDPWSNLLVARNPSATSIRRCCRGEFVDAAPGRRCWPVFGTPVFWSAIDANCPNLRLVSPLYATKASGILFQRYSGGPAAPQSF